MAYNNYFPAGYQPAQIYYPQTQQMTAQQPMQQNGSPIWVQGEAGAKSYLVAPNTTVVLWDSEAQSIYVKSADASGMPSIKTLDYTVRESASVMPKIEAVSAYASKEDVEYLKAQIDALKTKFDEKESAKK